MNYSDEQTKIAIFLPGDVFETMSFKKQLFAVPWLLLTLLLVLMSSAVSGADGTAQGKTEVSGTLPNIVVSIEPLYEIVASIAHQVVRPEVLYLNMSDVQQPLTKQQKTMLDKADVIIRVGQGFEPALDKYIHTRGRALENKTITLSLYIPLLDKEQLEDGIYIDRQHRSDLRFWMDPRLVKMLVIYIAPKLVAMDPDHLEEYLDNEVLVKDQLKKVEQKMLTLFRQLSLEQKVLIAQFNPYLKNRYMSFAEIKTVDAARFDRPGMRECIDMHSFDSIPLNLEYTEKALYNMVHTLEDCTQSHLIPTQ